MEIFPNLMNATLGKISGCKCDTWSKYDTCDFHTVEILRGVDVPELSSTVV